MPLGVCPLGLCATAAMGVHSRHAAIMGIRFKEPSLRELLPRECGRGTLRQNETTSAASYFLALASFAAAASILDLSLPPATQPSFRAMLDALSSVHPCVTP